MPNRIISEKIRTSKSINALSDFQFRLWTYLLTYVDDYGRGSADPELLKGFVFPRRNGVREQDIQKGLEALERNGSILRYDVAGEPYFCLPNWGKYQRIQTKKSKFPEPSENDISRWSTVTHGDSPLESNPESNPNPNTNTKDAPARVPRFQKPTVEEVRSFCKEQGYALDADYFCNYYESNGWKVGKNNMKDWKATVRNWVKRERAERSKTGTGPETTYDIEAFEQSGAFDDLDWRP